VTFVRPGVPRSSSSAQARDKWIERSGPADVNVSQPSALSEAPLVRRSSIVTSSVHAGGCALGLSRCHSNAIPADPQMASASAQIRYTSESVMSSGANTATEIGGAASAPADIT